MFDRPIVIDIPDPLVDVEDRFPLLPSAGSPVAVESAPREAYPAAPLGFRLAVHAIRSGKHGKTYTTVTETEDTERSDDGKVYTIPDTIRREEEID